MTIKQEIGRWGEDIALEYLEKSGYTILERNWRYSRNEIDIIAMKDDTLTFIEVKTRRLNTMESAEESPEIDQLERVQVAGSAYMEEIDHEWAISIDLICIDYYDREHYKVEHIEDVYFKDGWD